VNPYVQTSSDRLSDPLGSGPETARATDPVVNLLWSVDADRNEVGRDGLIDPIWQQGAVRVQPDQDPRAAQVPHQDAYVRTQQWFPPGQRDHRDAVVCHCVGKVERSGCG
jgi:hypothetical protein